MQIIPVNLTSEIYCQARNRQISFKSYISFENGEGFSNEINSFKQQVYVTSPWTAKEIVRTSQVFTDGVMDCVSGGIVLKKKNGFREVVFFHINSEEDFNETRKTLLDKIGNDEPCHGFLLGSKEAFEGSVENFKNIENFITQELKIPCTKFEGMPWGMKSAAIAYDGYKDKWTIFAGLLNLSKENFLSNLKNYFKNTFVCNEDTLITKS